MDETNPNASLDGYMYDRHARPRLERPDESRGQTHVPEATLRRIETPDGVTLGATVWDPPGRARDHVLVIASATGVLRSYYAPFAEWLASRGFAVVTFDYRGIGDSRIGAVELARAGEPSMHDWGERDLACLLAWAGTTLGNGRAALLGHSVGGQLVGLLPDHAQSRISALVTIGSQSGDFRLWPLPARLAMAVLWYGVVPGVTHAVGYLPGALGIGEDLPASRSSGHGGAVRRATSSARASRRAARASRASTRRCSPTGSTTTSTRQAPPSTRSTLSTWGRASSGVSSDATPGASGTSASSARARGTTRSGTTWPRSSRQRSRAD